jgi:ABC-type sugar transport system ATPase subunit
MNVFAASNGMRDLTLPDNAAFIGCRPEHFDVLSSGEGHTDATVKVKEQLGGESLLYLALQSGDEVVARVDGEDQTAVGQTVGLRIPDNRLHQFDTNGSAI